MATKTQVSTSVKHEGTPSKGCESVVEKGFYDGMLLDYTLALTNRIDA